MEFFLAAVIVGIFALIRRLWISGGRGKTSGEDAPLELLKRRYARGDINEDEFEGNHEDQSFCRQASRAIDARQRA